MSGMPIQGLQPPAPEHAATQRRLLTVSSRIVIWGAVQFCLSLAEQIAELLAPMLFIAGVAWWAVLRVINSIQLEDGQLQKLVERVPASLTINGHFTTPGGLIWKGLLMMALVAACRTANAIIAKET